uniref:ATG16 autophagy related 16-like 1 (S. cerevisiae) n=1 Tax=Poecilia reticulata TaxID=8081 RepID=A0A3P9QCN3_POERE
MAERQADCGWKRHISDQLKLRDRVQRHTFEEIVQQSLFLFPVFLLSPSFLVCPHPLSLDASRSDSLHQEMSQMRIRHQEELTELHKKRGELAQTVIELNNQIQQKDREIQSNEARMLEYQQQIAGLDGDCRDLRSSLQVRLHEEDQHSKTRRRFPHDPNGFMQPQSGLLDSISNIFGRRRSANSFGTSPETTEPPSGGCAEVRVPTTALHVFEAHDGEVNTVRFSPGSRLLATGGMDRRVKLWEVVAGELHTVTPQH